MAIPTIESIEEKIAAATAIQDGVVDAKNSAADAANRAEEVLANAAKLDGDNIFTGSDAFTGPVDLSAADLTLPADAIPGAALTQEQVDLLATYASSEGRNITPASDGLFATQIGHTYVITAGDTEVTVTSGADLSFVVPKNAQRGFVASTATATVSTTDCIITEVFKPAAPIDLNGSGDYLTFDANGAATGGRLENVTNINYLQHNRTTLTKWDIPLPCVTRAYSAFASTSLTEWQIALPALTNGSYMFQSAKFTKWNVDLPSLTNGSYMFASSKITEWNGDLSSLINGNRMFNYAHSLKTFKTELPMLNDGSMMFTGGSLTEWTIDMPKLTTGYDMFKDNDFEIFDADVSNVSNGQSMLQGNKITSFNRDLPKLSVAVWMFYGCTKLATFRSNLASLTNGNGMFGDSTSSCTRLDLASVQNIAATINDLASQGKTGTIHIGMQAALQSDDETAPINVALAAIRAKGWTVNEIYRA